MFCDSDEGSRKTATAEAGRTASSPKGGKLSAGKLKKTQPNTPADIIPSH